MRAMQSELAAIECALIGTDDADPAKTVDAAKTTGSGATETIEAGKTLLTIAEGLLENSSRPGAPAKHGVRLSRSDGAGPARYQTTVQTAWDSNYLYVAFRCEDDAILATMERRDDPLYEQEVVEVFIAPETLSSYFEFELSPRNVVFDAKVTHDGRTFHGDVAWDCGGLLSVVFRQSPGHEENLWQVDAGSFGSWVGALAIPFEALDGSSPRPGDEWRVNFYRIKRAPVPEFAAWSPTLAIPPNFHVPSRFGVLRFAGRLRV